MQKILIETYETVLNFQKKKKLLSLNANEMYKNH